MKLMFLFIYVIDALLLVIYSLIVIDGSLS